MKRREFLKTFAGMAALTVVPRHVLGGVGYTAPSDQLTKGIIGVGGMGRGHYGYAGTRLVAICDVDKNHLEAGRQLAGEKVATYSDYRQLIADPNVDIVHIATPPHWHGIMSVEAAAAGKDIWCEKPMTRTIGEGKRVKEAVERNGNIFRLNTWFRFTDTFYGMNTTVDKIKKLVVPAELYYDMWLGPAPYKPYNPHRVHGTFRGYWDYDAGGLGDMGQHYIDPVQYLLGKDDTSPVSVEIDAPQQHPDAVGTWRKIEYTYDDGCKIVLWGEDNGDPNDAYIEGPNGKLYRNFRCDIPDWEAKLAEYPDPMPQQTDFLDCVRTRRKFALNEQNGFRSATIVNMGAVALRLGRSLRFDPEKLQFIDDDAANRLIDQPMRAPWTI